VAGGKNLIPSSRFRNAALTICCLRSRVDASERRLPHEEILLIEDDTDLFALLKYNLEKEGFAMAGSQTGKGALDLCRQVRPDLILLDIMLPDYDGLEICKAVRKDRTCSARPSSS